MEARSPRVSTRVGVNDAYPARKSSEILAVAPVRRAATACPNSCTRVNTVTDPANQNPMGWPFTTTINSMNRTNPGRICTGNPRMRMSRC